MRLPTICARRASRFAKGSLGGGGGRAKGYMTPVGAYCAPRPPACGFAAVWYLRPLFASLTKIVAAPPPAINRVRNKEENHNQVVSDGDHLACLINCHYNLTSLITDGDYNPQADGHQASRQRRSHRHLPSAYRPLWPSSPPEKTRSCRLCTVCLHSVRPDAYSHILQDCPIFTAQRNQTRPRGADLNTKLWGSAADRGLTTDFMTATGLRVWMAIVERNEEDHWQKMALVSKNHLIDEVCSNWRNAIHTLRTSFSRASGNLSCNASFMTFAM